MRGRNQETKVQLFAGTWRRTVGRIYDLEVPNSKALSRVFRSLSDLAETAYVAGCYPLAGDSVLPPVRGSGQFGQRGDRAAVRMASARGPLVSRVVPD